jgi:hypothetical protein
MFCNYCGAPNPDAASFCSKCGKAIAETPASAGAQAQPAPAQPNAAAALTPAAVAFSSPIKQTSTAIGGTLTPAARIEFMDGLTAELHRQVEDKSFPGSIATGIVTLIAIARFNMTIAFVLAVVLAVIAFKVLNSVLENKYVRPIANLSDAMLITRYNEAKADRRAARTRTAISWAVIAIIIVLLAVAWMAIRRP